VPRAPGGRRASRYCGTLGAMRPLRYSINVTLDGCCDHREGIVDEDLHRHAAENLTQGKCSCSSEHQAHLQI
jgi:hypothetical protein